MAGQCSLLRAELGRPFRGAVQWDIVFSACAAGDELLPVRGSNQTTILLIILATILTTILTTTLITILRTKSAPRLRHRSAQKLPRQVFRQSRRALPNL